MCWSHACFYVDIDECDALIDDCDQSAKCTNTPGSFTCTCNQGYSGNGITCTGMNAICLLELKSEIIFYRY